MRNQTFRLICAVSLAFALFLVAAPSVQAVSYYAYLQQLLNGQPIPPQPTPDPQPVPVPSPAEPGGNYWDARAASRKALLAAAGLQPSLPKPDPQPAPPVEPNPTPQPSGLTAREQQMLDLINTDRMKYGLKPLVADLRLTRLARLKSQDIVDKNYFAHKSPTYGTVFDMLRADDIDFLRGGENLSKAGNVLVSHMRLMNSTNHRANLLTPQYTHIGIGIVDNNPSGIVVTEIFITKP